MMVVAIRPQNAERDSGIIARIAGSAVSTTGRARRTVASTMACEAFLKTLRVRDGQGTREVSKIVAAAEVCLNNALKGDLKSFAKVMEIADKFGLLKPGSIYPEITHITRTIVDPRDPDKAGGR